MSDDLIDRLEKEDYMFLSHFAIERLKYLKTNDPEKYDILSRFYTRVLRNIEDHRNSLRDRPIG